MKVYCPKCGSGDIFTVLPQTWSKYKCRDCGYIGVFVVSDGEMAEELRKGWVEDNK